MRKLGYIDALRGLAILGVIMVHAAQYGENNFMPFYQNIISNGARGVQLFFIASAFTLYLSFENRKRDEIRPITNFFIRRFFRIAPMYYLGIAYYLFQDGFGPKYWLGDASGISLNNIISNISFTSGFNPYWITSIVPGGWSIAVETTFYLTLPLLFLLIRNLNQAVYFFIVTILIRFVMSYVLTKYPLIGFERLWEEYLYFYFPNQLPIFSLGIILYFIIKDNIPLNGKILLVISAIIILQLCTGIYGLIDNFILFGFAFVLLGVALSRYTPVLIVNPIIKFIGRISYSIYLVHFAVLHWLTYFGYIDYVQHGLLNYLIRFLICTVLSVIASTCFYYWIEIPFQKLGKRIVEKLENSAKQFTHN